MKTKTYINTSKYYHYINSYNNELKKQNQTAAVRKFIPNQRTYNQRKSNEPGFVCSKCKCSFNMNYSRYGKFSCFEQSTYYCIDCSSSPKFIKM